MASPEFLQSKWANTDEGRYAQSRMTNVQWWEGLGYIIATVAPIYRFLRFADKDKEANMCQVVLEYQNCKLEMQSFFGRNEHTWKEYEAIMDRRIRDVYFYTYVGPGMIYMTYIYSSRYICSTCCLFDSICCSCCSKSKGCIHYGTKFDDVFWTQGCFYENDGCEHRHAGVAGG